PGGADVAHAGVDEHDSIAAADQEAAERHLEQAVLGEQAAVRRPVAVTAAPAGAAPEAIGVARRGPHHAVVAGLDRDVADQPGRSLPSRLPSRRAGGGPGA